MGRKKKSDSERLINLGVKVTQMDCDEIDAYAASLGVLRSTAARFLIRRALQLLPLEEDFQLQAILHYWPRLDEKQRQEASTRISAADLLPYPDAKEQSRIPVVPQTIRKRS